MLNIIKETSQKLISLFNRKDEYALFFSLLVFFFIIIPPIGWSDNEEQYYLLFHKTVQPESFPENHASFDSSKGRIVAAYLIGTIIKHFGYEISQVIIGLACIFGYSLAFSKLFSFYCFRVLDGLFVLAIFLLFGQDLFGGEWLFGRSGESKVFAYIFVILAIPLFFKGKYSISIPLLVSATYFHFLVGVFWTIFLLVNLLCFNKNPHAFLKNGFIFSLLVLPLPIIMLPELFSDSSSITGLSSDYIYSRIRHPHHLDPFLSVSWFTKNWAEGILAMLLLIPFFIWSYSKHNKDSLSGLLTTVSFFLIFFLILAYLDRNTFYLGKFYLFRPTSLLLLLSLVLMVVNFNKIQIETYTADHAYPFLALIVFSVLPFSASNIFNSITSRYSTPELLKAIQLNSEKNEIFLLDTGPHVGEKATGLVRDIPRPTLVEWKFVPTNKNEIQKWYKLILQKRNIFKRGCEGNQSTFKNFIIFDEETLKRFELCATIRYRDDNLIYFTIN